MTTEDTLTMQSSFPVRIDNGDLVIGFEDAPVTLMEYSSLSAAIVPHFITTLLPM